MMPEAQQRDGGARATNAKIDTLTSLRFFAALAIVVHHLADVGLTTPFLRSLPLDNGVSFFFVLSGFVMFVVYRDLSGGPARKAYLVARIARIYPLHLTTFILAVVLLSTDPSGSEKWELTWQSGILNALLLQAWVPIGTIFFGFNGVSWTLSAEMFFYVAFVGLVVDFRRRWPYALLGSAALVAILIVLCDRLHLTNYDDPLRRVNAVGLLYVNPLARLFEFVLGMCIGLASLATSRRFACNKWCGTLVELAAVLILVINALLVAPISEWFATHISASSEIWMSKGGAICLSTSLLIYVASFQAGYVSALLRLRWLVFLGEISFSIYLSHRILLFFLAVYTDWLQVMSPIAVLTIYLTALLLVSALLWRFVEIPARGFVRGAFARKAGKAFSSLTEPLPPRPN